MRSEVLRTLLRMRSDTRAKVKKYTSRLPYHSYFYPSIIIIIIVKKHTNTGVDIKLKVQNYKGVTISELDCENFHIAISNNVCANVI